MTLVMTLMEVEFMEEIWAAYPSFPRVEVSTKGRVRHTKSKRLKPIDLTKWVYLRFRFYETTEEGTVHRSVFVHRAMAETFLSRSEEQTQVNHLDANKHNNVIENLEWCTPSQNGKHASKMGLLPPVLRGSDNPKSKLTAEQRADIAKAFRKGHPELGLKGLGKKYGVHVNAIRKCIPRYGLGVYTPEGGHLESQSCNARIPCPACGK